MSRLAIIFLAAGLVTPGRAMISTTLSWTASACPCVAGYNIYYGGAPHQYTNVVSVGSVTNAIISNLAEGVTYFFAATARDTNGNESIFSNEAVFSGFTALPGAYAEETVLPTNSTADQLTFSLAADAPAGAAINSTNGVFGWCPGFNYASTTNTITVLVTDNTTGSTSSEVLVVAVTDYLQVSLGSATVQTGQSASLPIILAASDQVTNLQFSVPWPADRFAAPTLTYGAPVVAGAVQAQGGGLLVQLQIAPGQSFSTATAIAQLNFQALAGQASAFVSLQTLGVGGIKSDSSTYSNVSASPGEVTVVGANPLLQCRTSPGQNSLTLFGNPGANYQIQFTTNLTPPVAWTPLVNHQQSNVNESVNLDNSLPAVYYRLQQF